MKPRDLYLFGKSYYIRFSFFGQRHTFSLKVGNKKVADKIAEQVQIGLERGIFDSFERGSDGEKILRLLVARPGLQVEEATEEIVSSSKRKLLREAIDEYLAN